MSSQNVSSNIPKISADTLRNASKNKKKKNNQICGKIKTLKKNKDDLLAEKKELEEGIKSRGFFSKFNFVKKYRIKELRKIKHKLKESDIRENSLAMQLQDLSDDINVKHKLRSKSNYLLRGQYNKCVTIRNKLNKELEEQQKKLNDLRMKKGGIKALKRKIGKIENRGDEKKELEKLKESLVQKKLEERNLSRSIKDAGSDCTMLRKMMNNVEPHKGLLLRFDKFNELREAKNAFEEFRTAKKETRGLLEETEKIAVKKFGENILDYKNGGLNKEVFEKAVKDNQEQISKNPHNHEELSNFVLLNQLNDATNDLNELRGLAENPPAVTPEKMVELGEKVGYLKYAQEARRKVLNDYKKELEGGFLKDGLKILNEKIAALGDVENLKKLEKNNPEKLTQQQKETLKSFKKLSAQRNQLTRRLEGLKTDYDVLNKLIKDAPKTKDGLKELRTQVKAYKDLIKERKSALKKLEKTEHPDQRKDYENIQKIMQRASASPVTTQRLKQAKEEINQLKELQGLRDKASRAMLQAQAQGNSVKSSDRRTEYDFYKELDEKAVNSENKPGNLGLKPHLKTFRAGWLDRKRGKNLGIFDQLDRARKSLNKAGKKYANTPIHLLYKGGRDKHAEEQKEYLHALRQHQAIHTMIEDAKNKIPNGLKDLQKNIKELTDLQNIRKKAAKITIKARNKVEKQEKKISEIQKSIEENRAKLEAERKQDKPNSREIQRLEARIAKKEKQLVKQERILEQRKETLKGKERGLAEADRKLDLKFKECAPRVKTIGEMLGDSGPDVRPAAQSSASTAQPITPPDITSQAQRDTTKSQTNSQSISSEDELRVANGQKLQNQVNEREKSAEGFQQPLQKQQLLAQQQQLQQEQKSQLEAQQTIEQESMKAEKHRPAATPRLEPTTTVSSQEPDQQKETQTQAAEQKEEREKEETQEEENEQQEKENRTEPNSQQLPENQVDTQQLQAEIQGLEAQEQAQTQQEGTTQTLKKDVGVKPNTSPAGPQNQDQAPAASATKDTAQTAPAASSAPIDSDEQEPEQPAATEAEGEDEDEENAKTPGEPKKGFEEFARTLLGGKSLSKKVGEEEEEDEDEAESEIRVESTTGPAKEQQETDIERPGGPGGNEDVHSTVKQEEAPDEPKEKEGSQTPTPEPSEQGASAIGAAIADSLKKPKQKRGKGVEVTYETASLTPGEEAGEAAEQEETPDEKPQGLKPKPSTGSDQEGEEEEVEKSNVAQEGEVGKESESPEAGIEGPGGNEGVDSTVTKLKETPDGPKDKEENQASTPKPSKRGAQGIKATVANLFKKPKQKQEEGAGTISFVQKTASPTPGEGAGEAAEQEGTPDTKPQGLKPAAPSKGSKPEPEGQEKTSNRKASTPEPPQRGQKQTVQNKATSTAPKSEPPKEGTSIINKPGGGRVVKIEGRSGVVDEGQPNQSNPRSTKPAVAAPTPKPSGGTGNIVKLAERARNVTKAYTKSQQSGAGVAANPNANRVTENGITTYYDSHGKKINKGGKLKVEANPDPKKKEPTAEMAETEGMKRTSAKTSPRPSS